MITTNNLSSVNKQIISSSALSFSYSFRLPLTGDGAGSQRETDNRIPLQSLVVTPVQIPYFGHIWMAPPLPPEGPRKPTSLDFSSLTITQSAPDSPPLRLLRLGILVVRITLILQRVTRLTRLPSLLYPSQVCHFSESVKFHVSTAFMTIFFFRREPSNSTLQGKTDCDHPSKKV